MFDMILRRAHLVDGSITDIAIHQGVIAQVGNINTPARQEITLGGRFFLSAGWIDSHVHCYPQIAHLPR